VSSLVVQNPPHRRSGTSVPTLRPMTQEALTILQVVGVDPAQASEATVALAERLVESCEYLDQAAEELALILLATDTEEVALASRYRKGFKLRHAS
jgi:hypothetical protein